MLTTDLHDNILELINNAGRIKLARIYELFADHPTASISFQLEQLQRNHFCTIDPETQQVVANPRYSTPIDNALFEARDKAVSLLVALGEDTIKSYFFGIRYPVLMAFITTNDIIDYDLLHNKYPDVYDQYATSKKLSRILRTSYQNAYKDCVIQEEAAYDVVVMTYSNYEAIIGILPLIREHLDPGMNDSLINHIAIVQSQEMISSIPKQGPASFDTFVVVDDNGNVQFFKYDE